MVGGWLGGFGVVRERSFCVKGTILNMESRQALVLSAGEVALEEVC